MRVDHRGNAAKGEAAGETWRVSGSDIGCDGIETVEFAFGESRIEALDFGGTILKPNDPALEWFTLAGDHDRGGPFPPAFQFSPYDRQPLAPRRKEPRFGDPFEVESLRGDMTGESHRRSVARPTEGRPRTIAFAKAHHGFFACGPNPRLHALSEEGHVEWFAAADLFASAPDARIEGHSYGEPLGPLLPRHRHAVAVGGRGFATVARDRPVWVRATPLPGDMQARDYGVCDQALGAPILAGDSFHWPIRIGGKTKIATRRDEAGAPWTVTDCDDPVGDDAFTPPHRRDGDVLVWTGTRGYLIVESGRPRWFAWPEGHGGLPHLAPYVDRPGNLWQLTASGDGYAFVKLSSGRQSAIAVNEYHVSGGGFTLHGRDFFEDPTYGERTGELQVVDGSLVVPIFAWDNGAVVAQATLPPGTSPDAFFLSGSRPPAKAAYRLLSFADHSLTDLRAGIFPVGHARDLVAFVYGGHLFLTSSLETRCILWPLERD